VDESLRRVVDAIPGLVWSADPSGSFDFLNQRWCEYTGLSLAEARGAGRREAICPRDLPALLEHWQALLDGDYRWFLFRTVWASANSGAGSKFAFSIQRADSLSKAALEERQAD
jgi:PAS domain S-box-containing protein